MSYLFFDIELDNLILLVTVADIFLNLPLVANNNCYDA